MSGISFFLYWKYSLAGIFLSGVPFTITCEPTSLVGFNNMGFISTHGAIPAASACITCALPISRPFAVMYEFNAIFCDLKGAALYPSCFSTLNIPAVIMLFPALDIVP